MKGQKVYIVTEESAVGGMHDINVRVFAEIKEAQECFNETAQLWKDGNDDRWNQSEGEGYYEAWNEGYYDEDHVTVNLDEKEVE